MDKAIVSGLLLIAAVAAAVITISIITPALGSDRESITKSNRIATDFASTGVEGLSAVVGDGGVISAWFKNVGSADIEPLLAMDVFLMTEDGLAGRYIPFAGAPDRWSVLVPPDTNVWPRGDTIQIQLTLDATKPLAFGTHVISLTTPNGVSGDITFGYGAVPTPTETPIPQFTLLTVAVPTAGGALTGGGVYVSGTTVPVTATADSGYTFGGWSGACAGTGACTVTMDADKTVTANFVQRQFSLNVVAAPTAGGTVTGGGSYASGTTVPVTAIPNAGYMFNGWSGACLGTGACTVTMDADKTVTASFQ